MKTKMNYEAALKETFTDFQKYFYQKIS